MTDNECKKDREYIKGRGFLRQPGPAILSLLLVFTITLGIFMVIPAPIEAITLRELGNAIAKLDSEQEKLLEEIVASETIVARKTTMVQMIKIKVISQLRRLGICMPRDCQYLFTAAPIPCIAPHNTKVQPAPCQRPPRTKITNKFRYVRHSPLRLPPRGI